MKIVTGAEITKVETTAKTVKITHGDGTESFEYLAIAAGRRADTDPLGLAEAGIETDERGFVKVDGMMKTSREGIYAIGDLVPGPALAHVASDEGVIAVEHAAGKTPMPSTTARSPPSPSATRRSPASGSPNRRQRTPATTW